MTLIRTVEFSKETSAGSVELAQKTKQVAAGKKATFGRLRISASGSDGKEASLATRRL